MPQVNEAAIVATVQRAIALARSGRMAEAIATIERDRDALGHPAACNVLGALYMQSGAAEKALPLFDRSVALAPGFADAHGNRAVVLQQMGKLQEALAACDAALRADPHHLNALANRGSVLKLLGRPDEAIAAFNRILALQPGAADARLRRAYLHSETRNHQAALDDFDAVLRQAATMREAAFGRISALTGLRRFDEALAGIDWILAGAPLDADARLVRVQLLVELDRDEEALAGVEVLMREGLGGSKAAIVRANALWRLGRIAEARAAIDDAVRLNPGDAQARQARSQYCLATGDFAEGWREYEFRGDGFDPKQAEIERAAPRWRGEDLAGKTLLVAAEQGSGDTLQFLRFLPMLPEGGTLKVLVQPGLLRLASSLAAPVQWFDRLSAVGAFDYQVPLLSLPPVLGTTLDTLPARVPYLAADAVAVAKWATRVGNDSFKVGIVWQGNPNYPHDRRRSVPLRHYAPLAATPGVRLVSLQAVHGLDQLGSLPTGMTVEQLGPEITENREGMSEIAAVMANLDLVVASDTAVAHLAGALGRPVWVALSDDPDWRWMRERADSPWYPTMRLFRQTQRGDWPGVYSRLAEALAEAVKDRTAGV